MFTPSRAEPIEDHRHAVRMLHRAQAEGVGIAVMLWRAAERRLRPPVPTFPHLARPDDVAELEALWMRRGVA